ncbi:ubiquinone biosynthesis monooxygenase COQ6 [Pseudovirgaria hyperparasitica]|uniref:Ubiquinone biosynthesis monooxygenase COQ6, mitochondrial n=1 Tax=Pseudovirgaria hyperparasitica TaxID=470096 RepID=A0A6A6VZR0_9PEZI|nr:ubiquinone biosynthesis monooxygenase COQ6 [Pseudovirgaria hyperparasitica]KAF2754301.1 ubiquinone biosynthesis monooxygenase COQ6 [Pseudovirgaria hyperparasitica]
MSLGPGVWRPAIRRGCKPCSSIRLIIVARRGYASTTESIPEIYDVVCVGGGPAGLSLLSGLRATKATSGLRIALIESQDLQKSVFKRDSQNEFSNRCSSLTPASVSYFKKIGAWAHFDTSRIQPYQEMQVWDGISDSRISFDWGNLQRSPNPHSTIAYMTENLNITNALRSHLSSLGGIDIFSPAKVDAINFGPETEDTDLSAWPTVTLSTGQTIAARLLVGADGANSPVRTFAGIESRGWDYGRHGVVATLRLQGPGWGGNTHKIAYQRFLPTGPIAMLPLPGNMASLVWSTTPERASRLKSLSPTDFVAMVNAAFRLSAVDLSWLHDLPSGQDAEVQWREANTPVKERAIPMRVTSVQEGTVASFPLKMRHADTYTGERVALVGDAAHTIHPLAGQGLNQGQADVAALLDTIETAVVHGQDIGSTISLEAYNAARYAENNALLGVVDKLHMLYSVESGPIVGLRSLGLSAVNAMGPVKEFFMRRAAGA